MGSGLRPEVVVDQVLLVDVAITFIGYSVVRYSVVVLRVPLSPFDRAQDRRRAGRLPG